jgi:hypothetical protein
MPGLSGYEVAERAQRMRPGLKVILLSGAETDPRGLPIRKPFRPIRSHAGDGVDDLLGPTFRDQRHRTDE